MAKRANSWANVVIAMLSVNQFSAMPIANELEANGFFKIENLAAWDYPEMYAALEKSGYTRGTFMVGSMAERLMSLGTLAANMQENEQMLANGTPAEVSALLSPVNGIGPVVIKNFLAVRELELFSTE